MFYRELTERLICLGVVPLYFPVGAVGGAIVTLVEQRAYLGKGFVRSRRCHLRVGHSCPQGNVVERNAVGVRAAIHHGSQRAIAYHKGFLEVFGRPVVMECEPAAALSGYKHRSGRQAARHAVCRTCPATYLIT